jgi:glycosyltransferase involved in cell wall biosynthesis
MSNHLVIGIYYHPEAYPPTLNAVQELSACFSGITIVHRPHLKGSWKYPANVQAIASGEYITAKGQEQSSIVRKVSFFRQFTADLLRAVKRNKPSVILLYDVHALFAYRLIRPLIGKHVAWYHNHDVSEVERERKYSIGWFACKAEKKLFRHLDIFTLPAADRLRYFPVDTLKGKQFVVPNFPSIHFYSQFYQPKPLGNDVRLIFQGRIGEGHGLEEIIPLLAEPINGRQLHLVLKGHCEESYRQALEQLAAKHNVQHKLSFAGFTPYEEVPKLAASCHIGIGIFAKKETMHITLGTASNKLYEYAAVGLPVIFLDEEHFSRYLKQYDWAFPVSLSSASIEQAVLTIMQDYERYSASAYNSFTQSLNFENSFKPVMQHLRQSGLCKN